MDGKTLGFIISHHIRIFPWLNVESPEQAANVSIQLGTFLRRSFELLQRTL